MRIVLVILAALIVAGGTGFYVMQGLRPSEPAAVAEAATATRDVYVPAQDIAVGTIITPDRLSTIALGEPAITGQMIVADADGAAYLTGSVARQVLPQGVPVARLAIVQPGDRGFLAAVLPKGKRAITIPIDAIAGLSGLALPGDRVDLILTYTVNGGSDTAAAIRASETVIENIRVLAFDQRLGPNLEAEKNGGEAETPPVATTATLEVTPEQAEMVTLAQTMGSLSLILNSVRADDNRAETRPVSSARALESLVGKAAAAQAPRRLTLESDVTSTTKVQVVRGVTIHASPTTAAPAVPTE
jgi:pilus assembly protein CpaB